MGKPYNSEDKILSHQVFRDVFRVICSTNSPPSYSPTPDVLAALFDTLVKKWLHTREKEYLGTLIADAPSIQVALRTMLSVATTLNYEPSLEDVLDAY